MSYSSCKLYCLGGRDEDKSSLSSVSCLNVSTGKWNIVTSMLDTRNIFGGAVIGSKIYVFGGFDLNRLKTMEVYDCPTNTWTQLADMPEGRYSFGAAALKSFIYVAGGYGEGDKLNSSVVRYCSKTNEWQTVKSMKKSRNGPQLIELKGRLYAICGENTNTVEEYDPTTDQWTLVARSKYQHYRSGATVHKGKIYVCSHLGFEVYSPQSNTWETLTPLDDNWGRTLVSINGKLLALGGGKSNKATKSVHEFDSTSGKWTQLPDMEVARMYHCSFVFRAKHNSID